MSKNFDLEPPKAPMAKKEKKGFFSKLFSSKDKDLAIDSAPTPQKADIEELRSKLGIGPDGKSAQKHFDALEEESQSSGDKQAAQYEKEQDEIPDEGSLDHALEEMDEPSSDPALESESAPTPSLENLPDLASKYDDSVLENREPDSFIDSSLVDEHNSALEEKQKNSSFEITDFAQETDARNQSKEESVFAQEEFTQQGSSGDDSTFSQEVPTKFEAPTAHEPSTLTQDVVEEQIDDVPQSESESPFAQETFEEEPLSKESSFTDDVVEESSPLMRDDDKIIAELTTPKEESDFAQEVEEPSTNSLESSIESPVFVDDEVAEPVEEEPAVEESIVEEPIVEEVSAIVPVVVPETKEKEAPVEEIKKETPKAKKTSAKKNAKKSASKKKTSAKKETTPSKTTTVEKTPLEATTKELEELKKAIVQQQKKSDKEELKYDKLVTAGERKLQKQQSKFDTLSVKQAKQKDQLIQREQKVKAQEKDFAKKTKQLSQLQKDITLSTTQKQKLTTLITTTKKQISEKEKRLKTLNKDIANREKEVENKAKELETMKKNEKKFLAEQKKSQDMLATREEAVLEKINKNEKILRSIELKQNLLLELEERIEQEGFQSYINAKLDQINPDEGTLSDEEHIFADSPELGSKIHHLMIECRQELQMNHFAQAKKLYAQVREEYAKIELPHEEKVLLYSKIRELYDDINLHMLQSRSEVRSVDVS